MIDAREFQIALDICSQFEQIGLEHHTTDEVTAAFFAYEARKAKSALEQLAFYYKTIEERTKRNPINAQCDHVVAKGAPWCIKCGDYVE